MTIVTWAYQTCINALLVTQVNCLNNQLLFKVHPQQPALSTPCLLHEEKVDVIHIA